MQGLLDFESPEDLGIDSSDQEGGLAKNGPKRTKDSAFSAELQQALAMMEDLIKSCELAVDLAAVTGCPISEEDQQEYIVYAVIQMVEEKYQKRQC
ncbi:probable guanine nucleotide exchange factor MCF2L2 [Leptonychotes weddellii]|uniref:Probable guanine nucleotide exchange factor MCF2L2 n=1 Tax=Leptonychotes weddellii TaxID=9713 RepID=A0A7F8QC95_LEPWE|nr:probable guanine nucleotide exchange factor MCF2L2 [Leptonychotes weddellii]